MSKLNEEQINELRQIKQWVSVIVEYIGKVSPSGVPTYHTQAMEVIKQTYEKQDLRGMRLILKDITEWSKSLNKSQIDELNGQLRLKFGKDLNFKK